MKLISYSMHWGWKISLAVAVLILAATWIKNAQEMVLSVAPVAIWLTIRWLVIAKAE